MRSLVNADESFVAILTPLTRTGPLALGFVGFPSARASDGSSHQTGTEEVSKRCWGTRAHDL